MLCQCDPMLNFVMSFTLGKNNSSGVSYDLHSACSPWLGTVWDSSVLSLLCLAVQDAGGSRGELEGQSAISGIFFRLVILITWLWKASIQIFI